MARIWPSANRQRQDLKTESGMLKSDCGNEDNKVWSHAAVGAGYAFQNLGDCGAIVRIIGDPTRVIALPAGADTGIKSGYHPSAKEIRIDCRGSRGNCKVVWAAAY
jgi:hypothetical protein